MKGAKKGVKRTASRDVKRLEASKKYLVTRICIRPARSAATVCGGRIVYSGLNCICSQAQQDGGVNCLTAHGHLDIMYILLCANVEKCAQSTHHAFKTDRYIRYIPRKSCYRYMCPI